MNEFKSIGIEDKVEFINAIRPDINHVYRGRIGCALSHKECIKIANEKSYSKILVLEDDIQFEQHILDELSRCIYDLQIFSWELFYSGCNLSLDLSKPGIRDVTRNLLKITCGLTTHFVAYNQRIYDYLLNNLPDETNGVEWMSRFESLDGFLARFVQCRQNSFHSMEYLALQRPGYSDIDNKESNFGQDLKKHFYNVRKETLGW